MTDWLSAWENGKAPWHQEEFHAILRKHTEKITNNLTNAKLFFPLCGKAVDILYLSQMGHEVIGVEYSELAVKQFFEENNIPFNAKLVPEVGVLYENNDCLIKIYCCDFFKFNSNLEKNFDGVWDRGALEAIEEAERGNYTRIVKTICKPNAGYLLETADRPPGVGPPYYVSSEDISTLFGLNSQPDQVAYEEAPPEMKAVGCNGFFFYCFKMP